MFRQTDRVLPPTQSSAYKQLSNPGQVEQFRNALVKAESDFNRAYADWQHRVGEGPFSDAKRRFDELRGELNDIPNMRKKALDQLRQHQRKLQLDRFLDKFKIEYAKINGIGPGRKRTLESYGIETAEDVVPHRIAAVPGFGSKMIERLMKWRRSLERRFVFDPARGIDPRDIAKVEQEILNLRTKTASAAKAAYAKAVQIHARILAIRTAMRPQVEALQVSVAQARADYEFVKG